jgi:hypothetical protein
MDTDSEPKSAERRVTKQVSHRSSRESVFIGVHLWFPSFNCRISGNLLADLPEFKSESSN